MPFVMPEMPVRLVPVKAAASKLLLISAMLVLPCFVAAQNEQSRSEPADAQDSEVLRVDTDLITFDVAVTDAVGRPVRGLRASDFRIYEDNVERPIEFFEATQKSGGKRPLAVVFALDVSGSVSIEEIERLRAATRAFVGRLADYDSVFAIMAFGMNVKTVQSFTNSQEKLERSFDKLLREPSGLSTHTYDAVDDAVRLLGRKAPKTRAGGVPTRKAVVVVTDGFPVGDTIAPKTLIERAQAAEVSIFTVTLPSYSKLSWRSNRAPLPTPLDVSGLVERTGGKNVYATDKDFEPLFRGLAEDVASSYLVAFQPKAEKRRDGRFHTVRVLTRDGLVVRQNRAGYQLPVGGNEK